MNIPFVDFSEQYNTIKSEFDVNLQKVLNKANFILGEEEKQFEKSFPAYCTAKYGVGVNSGTDALYLALCALDIKAGDEVILPTYTFIATALCISYTGAKPVFVDIDEETYNMDPKLIKKAITKKTKVIMPVHLYGQPADMDEINALAKEHGLTVIEDAAQAHGAMYKGKRVGSLGDIACFSFYPTKSLGAFGDAGMIVTSNQKVYEKATMLRDYGRVGRYEHKIKGWNSRLDTIQAVVLEAKLKYLDQWNKMRHEKAALYEKLLKDTGVVLPRTKKDRTHVYQTFAVAVENRNQVLEELKKRGVNVLIHYPIPVHLQEAYSDLGYKKGDFPKSEYYCDRILSLPMFPHMTNEQIEYVCDTLKDVIGSTAKASLKKPAGSVR